MGGASSSEEVYAPAKQECAKQVCAEQECAKQECVKLKTDQIVVAAIDFGTTFTGFAFSLSNDPTQIISSKWSGENVRTVTEKAPTCVLLSPDKKFVAFGYEAEEKYRSLLDEDKEAQNREVDSECSAKAYYYFEQFKMKLYQTKKLRLDTQLADINGKELPAIDVFAVVISHLKDKLHSQIKRHFDGFNADDILWMITVPAIWSDSAKQFMRKAADKAGLEATSVKLILEPEAASLYCNDKKLCKTMKLDGSFVLERLPVGQKYIVADLGGGTADLSVHEILPDRNLKEIKRSDGDAIGGISVDTAFFEFLEEILGSNVMQHIRDTCNCKSIVMDIQRDFETKKRTFDPQATDEIRIRIPKADLMEILSELNEESIETKVKSSSEKPGYETLKLVTDKLCFGKTIMEMFFLKTTDRIVSFIQKMREDDELGEINTLLMVGGFSESAYVQNIIRRDVQGMRVIVPLEPSLAVLKGAVVAGRNPKVITERIARYSYGFSFTRKFQPGEDPEELKKIRNGQELCESAFEKMITKGDILKDGTFHGKCEICLHIPDSSNPLRHFMPISAEVYRSKEQDPKYTDEKYGSEFIGLMLVGPPRSGWPHFTVQGKGLVVKESELSACIIEGATGQIFDGHIDCLI